MCVLFSAAPTKRANVFLNQNFAIPGGVSFNGSLSAQALVVIFAGVYQFLQLPHVHLSNSYFR